MVGIVVGAMVVSTAVQIGQAKKDAKAGKNVNNAQRKINTLKNKQAKRDFLKKFRQAQGAVYQNAVAAGVGLGSSAFQGTRSSQAAQAGLAAGEFGEFEALGAEMTKQMNKQADAQFRSQVAGSVAGIASSFASGLDFGGGAAGGGVSEIDTSTFTIKHPKRF